MISLSRGTTKAKYTIEGRLYFCSRPVSEDVDRIAPYTVVESSRGLWPRAKLPERPNMWRCMYNSCKLFVPSISERSFSTLFSNDSIHLGQSVMTFLLARCKNTTKLSLVYGRRLLATGSLTRRSILDTVSLKSSKANILRYRPKKYLAS